MKKKPGTAGLYHSVANGSVDFETVGFAAFGVESLLRVHARRDQSHFRTQIVCACVRSVLHGIERVHFEVQVAVDFDFRSANGVVHDDDGCLVIAFEDVVLACCEGQNAQRSQSKRKCFNFIGLVLIRREITRFERSIQNYARTGAKKPNTANGNTESNKCAQMSGASNQMNWL